jgi:hypothetical protein
MCPKRSDWVGFALPWLEHRQHRVEEQKPFFMGKTKSYLIHRFTQISTDKIGSFVIMKSVAMDFAFRFPLPFTVDPRRDRGTSRLPFTHLFLVPQQGALGGAPPA